MVAAKAVAAIAETEADLDAVEIAVTAAAVMIAMPIWTAAKARE